MITLALLALSFLSGTCGPAPQASEADSKIHVRPAQVVNHITPYMYGACIEDVNHEIYGGLYAQRIFGESFEEPPTAAPIPGWQQFGGNWQVQDGAIHVAAEAGAKLIRAQPVVGNGTVSCDIRFADLQGDNAGLILCVSDPHTGADNWTGYEISLRARSKSLILGRHHNNWEPLKEVAAPIEAERWHHLRVDLRGPTLQVFLDDATPPILEYTDTKDPLPAGQIGLRTWNSNAAFRNVSITTNGKSVVDKLITTSGSTVSGMWDAITTGGVKSHDVWDGANPYNSAHSQQISYLGGTGTTGIANRGLNRWGIAVRKGQPFAGHLYLRQSNYKGPVTVALQSADGSRTYAQQRIASLTSDWTRHDFTLTPNSTDPKARFALWLDRPGTVWVDQVYLSETGKSLFHGLPVRADIGDKLVAGGLTFLRYGGTMVNAPEYRWKKMIGSRDKRPQYAGHWYPQSSNGFGIEEFIQFCESAHIEPAFAINIEETPEDAADLVEYLNGPATSVWGGKRAANGHPKPYHVHYIEIGNEEALDGSTSWYRRYLERFKLLYAAMRPHDPNLNYVIAAWWRPDEPLCKQIAQELNGKAALWDVHVDADNLRDADRVDLTLTQMQELFGAWIPGTKMRACIFEENGDRHDMQRALGHARILNVTQRHGDFVQMDCPANCLQPFGENDNGWNQGQVFFLPDKVWAMPPYYVQQLAAANHLPLRIACEVDSPDHDLDCTATRSEDGNTLVLMVVNSSAKSHAAILKIDDFLQVEDRSLQPPVPADVWTLTGDVKAVNTPGALERLHPVYTRLDLAYNGMTITFAAYSYTVLRLQKR